MDRDEGRTRACAGIAMAVTVRLLEGTIPVDFSGLRGDVALARMFPEHSRSRLQGWGRAGRITFDGRPADLARKVWGGELVRVEAEPGPDETAFHPEAIGIKVVYEDATILVIDKPAGLVVHPAAGHWDGTLLNALLHHAPELAALPRAGIVHRLDKDTSGLMVVARTDIAQTHLVRQLQARTVKRQYLALVAGHVAAPGMVDAPIGRDPNARTRMAVVSTGKPARTHYRPLRHFAEPVPLTLLECALDTGRTHQIRVHMRSIGHPLVGDPAYGARRNAIHEALRLFRRQALHASRLALVHPASGETCEWSTPVPADFDALLEALA